MNGAIGYIEDNLVNEIDYTELSKIVCCSTYHFQKMFSFLTGISLSEYIRRRRLTQSAYELRSGSIKVIDIALKYGYESPDAFTRAFQNLHGVTPTSARNMGVKLKAYPRMSFQISIKGDVELNCKIEEKKAFTIVGKKIRVKNVDEYNPIPSFWFEANTSGLSDEICKLSKPLEEKETGMSLLGVCSDFGAPNEFDYWIAIESDKDNASGDFENLEIPAATWAIFETVGAMPKAIQYLWERIFKEFFQDSGYERANLPDMEVYPPGDVNSPDYRSEIWVPVIKK
jgi:AraC family transcriptional regulator